MILAGLSRDPVPALKGEEEKVKNKISFKKKPQSSFLRLVC